MAGINKVIIVGRLGKDPELKDAGSSKVCSFSVATSREWTKDGEKKSKTEWHEIRVWGKLAEICGKHLKKGSQAYVEGELETQTWEKDGNKHSRTIINAQTVQFLGSKSQGSDEEPSFNTSDEIPF